MIEQQTLYDILAIEPNAPIEKIRAIYRLRTRESHPDRKHGNEQQQKLLNEAYEILGNPEKRKEYNQQMGLPLKTRPIKSGKPTYQEIAISPQQTNQPISYTFKRWEPCRHCWGEGCSSCQDKGRILKTVHLIITIPIGISQVVVKGQGTRIEPGGSRGDLILYVVWK